MKLFGEITDEDNPSYPGIGLISTASQDPILVQKCHYDEDRFFEGLFDPHPKHGFTALPASVKTEKRITSEKSSAHIMLTGRSIVRHGATFQPTKIQHGTLARGQHIMTLDYVSKDFALPALHIHAPSETRIGTVFTNKYICRTRSGEEFPVADDQDKSRIELREQDAELSLENRFIEMELGPHDPEFRELIIKTVKRYCDAVDEIVPAHQGRKLLERSQLRWVLFLIIPTTIAGGYFLSGMIEALLVFILNVSPFNNLNLSVGDGFAQNVTTNIARALALFAGFMGGCYLGSWFAERRFNRRQHKHNYPNSKHMEDIERRSKKELEQAVKSIHEYQENLIFWE